MEVMHRVGSDGDLSDKRARTGRNKGMILDKTQRRDVCGGSEGSTFFSQGERKFGEGCRGG